MKTLNTILFAIMAVSSVAQSTKNKSNMSKNVTEVVIYQIKAEKIKDFPAILEKVRANVSNAPGFVSYKTLRWTKEPNEFIASENAFIDIVEWKTLDDAANAMKVAEQNLAFGEFLGSIEKITVMGHFDFYK
jgi:heme-degrading monooxygenase HmoA